MIIHLTAQNLAGNFCCKHGGLRLQISNGSLASSFDICVGTGHALGKLLLILRLEFISDALRISTRLLDHVGRLFARIGKTAFKFSLSSLGGGTGFFCTLDLANNLRVAVIKTLGDRWPNEVCECDEDHAEDHKCCGCWQGLE